MMGTEALLMAEPIRKFDISWLPKVLPKKDSGPRPTPVDTGEGLTLDRPVTVESTGQGKSSLLQALRAHEGQAYVVDLAKDTKLDFQTTLSTILELTAAGDVKIVERDRNAADHLVALSDG